MRLQADLVNGYKPEAWRIHVGVMLLHTNRAVSGGGDKAWAGRR